MKPAFALVRIPAVTIATILFFALMGQAEEKVLRFGMSTALTGPAADLGTNMRQGVELAFTECNETEILPKYRLQLIAYDDGYEPSRTIPNMWRLIREDKVIAVVGNVGTPTAVAAIQIANLSETLFFGAFTGASILRQTPPDRFVINFRASYAEEITAMIAYLMDVRKYKMEEIAFFTQGDQFGQSGYLAGIDQLRLRGLEDVSSIIHVQYPRNTLDVEEAVATLLERPVPPKAVIIVGVHGPVAAFINIARHCGLSCEFLSVSFVGSKSLADSLGDRGEGVIVTQVVPHYDSDHEIAVEYRSAMSRWTPQYDNSFIRLEGYIVGRILIAAIKQATCEVTHESMPSLLEGMRDVDIGLPTPITLNKEEHQASHSVWPTIIRGGRLMPFDWTTPLSEYP